jgi:3-oxoacyl-(acyl-carrier-protein) synthase
LRDLSALLVRFFARFFARSNFAFAILFADFVPETIAFARRSARLSAAVSFVDDRVDLDVVEGVFVLGFGFGLLRASIRSARASIRS